MAGLTVAIQAGGKSTRMGQNKAFVLVNGRPMIEVVRQQVQGLGDELILITNEPAAYAHLELPMFEDVYKECGSLGGIFTAVTHAQHPHTLVVACDMPWLNRDLLSYMMGLRDIADIVVPRWEKFPEPLHAIYHKACLPAIEEALQAGQFKITGFFGKMRLRFVEREEISPFDPNGRSFANINTPEDLSQHS